MFLTDICRDDLAFFLGGGFRKSFFKRIFLFGSILKVVKDNGSINLICAPTFLSVAKNAGKKFKLKDRSST